MTQYPLRVPDSMMRVVKDLAKSDKISVNQFVVTAIAEKVSALSTIEILEERAQNASKKAFMQALAKVPNIPVENPKDRI